VVADPGGRCGDPGLGSDRCALLFLADQLGALVHGDLGLMKGCWIPACAGMTEAGNRPAGTASCATGIGGSGDRRYRAEIKATLPYTCALADGSSYDCSVALIFVPCAKSTEGWSNVEALGIRILLLMVVRDQVALPLHARRHHFYQQSQTRSYLLGRRPANLRPALSGGMGWKEVS